MPQFPNSFQPKRESITSFNFTDIASGLGYEDFFLHRAIDSVSVKKFLTSISLSDIVGGKSIADNQTLTDNFDTSVFNLPRTVKGTAYFNFKVTNTASTGTDTVSVQLVKVLVDDSTEDLSSEITTGDIPLTTELFRILEVPLTQTLIKKGEKIRLILKLVEESTGILSVFTDGTGKISIPFRIDTT